MLNRESSIIYPGKSHRLLEKMNDDETIDRIKSIADQLQFVTNDIKKQYFPLAKVLTSQQFITNQNIFVEMAVLRVLIQFSRLYRLKTAWITVPIEKLYQLILNCVKYIFSTEISLTTDQTAILKDLIHSGVFELLNSSEQKNKISESFFQCILGKVDCFERDNDFSVLVAKLLSTILIACEKNLSNSMIDIFLYFGNSTTQNYLPIANEIIGLVNKKFPSINRLISKRVKRGNIYSLFDISSYPWKYNDHKLNYKIDKASMKRILCKFNIKRPIEKFHILNLISKSIRCFQASNMEFPVLQIYLRMINDTDMFVMRHITGLMSIILTNLFIQANLNAISFEIKNKELLKSLYESSISSNGDIRLRICTAIIDAITSNNELYESSNLLTILKQRSYDVDILIQKRLLLPMAELYWKLLIRNIQDENQEFDIGWIVQRILDYSYNHIDSQLFCDFLLQTYVVPTKYEEFAREYCFMKLLFSLEDLQFGAMDSLLKTKMRIRANVIDVVNFKTQPTNTIVIRNNRVMLHTTLLSEKIEELLILCNQYDENVVINEASISQIGNIISSSVDIGTIFMQACDFSSSTETLCALEEELSRILCGRYPTDNIPYTIKCFYLQLPALVVNQKFLVRMIEWTVKLINCDVAHLIKDYSAHFRDKFNNITVNQKLKLLKGVTLITKHMPDAFPASCLAAIVNLLKNDSITIKIDTLKILFYCPKSIFDSAAEKLMNKLNSQLLRCLNLKNLKIAKWSIYVYYKISNDTEKFFKEFKSRKLYRDEIYRMTTEHIVQAGHICLMNSEIMAGHMKDVIFKLISHGIDCTDEALKISIKGSVDTSLISLNSLKQREFVKFACRWMRTVKDKKDIRNLYMPYFVCIINLKFIFERFKINAYNEFMWIALTASFCLLNLCSYLRNREISIATFDAIYAIASDDCADIRTQFQTKLKKYLLNISISVGLLPLLLIDLLLKCMSMDGLKENPSESIEYFNIQSDLIENVKRRRKLLRIANQNKKFLQCERSIPFLFRMLMLIKMNTSSVLNERKIKQILKIYLTIILSGTHITVRNRCVKFFKDFDLQLQKRDYLCTDMIRELCKFGSECVNQLHFDAPHTRYDTFDNKIAIPKDIFSDKFFGMQTSRKDTESTQSEKLASESIYGNNTICFDDIFKEIQEADLKKSKLISNVVEENNQINQVMDQEYKNVSIHKEADQVIPQSENNVLTPAQYTQCSSEDCVIIEEKTVHSSENTSEKNCKITDNEKFTSDIQSFDMKGNKTSHVSSACDIVINDEFVPSTTTNGRVDTVVLIEEDEDINIDDHDIHNIFGSISSTCSTYGITSSNESEELIAREQEEIFDFEDQAENENNTLVKRHAINQSEHDNSVNAYLSKIHHPNESNTIFSPVKESKQGNVVFDEDKIKDPDECNTKLISITQINVVNQMDVLDEIQNSIECRTISNLISQAEDNNTINCAMYGLLDSVELLEKVIIQTEKSGFNVSQAEHSPKRQKIPTLYSIQLSSDPIDSTIIDAAEIESCQSDSVNDGTERSLNLIEQSTLQRFSSICTLTHVTETDTVADQFELNNIVTDVLNRIINSVEFTQANRSSFNADLTENLLEHPIIVTYSSKSSEYSSNSVVFSQIELDNIVTDVFNEILASAELVNEIMQTDTFGLNEAQKQSDSISVDMSEDTSEITSCRSCNVNDGTKRSLNLIEQSTLQRFSSNSTLAHMTETDTVERNGITTDKVADNETTTENTLKRQNDTTLELAEIQRDYIAVSVTDVSEIASCQSDNVNVVLVGTPNLVKQSMSQDLSRKTSKANENLQNSFNKRKMSKERPSRISTKRKRPNSSNKLPREVQGLLFKDVNKKRRRLSRGYSKSPTVPWRKQVINKDATPARSTRSHALKSKRL
ncbi:hypothetical protein GJ496_000837 [Pomphorhynchus laevis]|nr:hypothetical protein GJ496_000837 [Pomphorhynchus laevis]